MKILLTGANGMLAKAVKNEFQKEEIICTDKMELDITNRKAVLEFVKQIKPDCIINCAAYTEVDKAEQEKEIAEKVNANGPENLAIAAKENNILLIHISTDYVFGGDKNVNNAYTEEEETNPLTVYGITKLEGEKNIKNNCNKYYIFRTAWLYGDGKNFVKTMINLAQTKTEITVVKDEYGSPTYAVDLANIIHQAIEKQIPYGTYHATNEGFTTWFEFAKKIFEFANINCEVKPINAIQFNRVAKRPKNSKLSKEKILKQGINIPKYEDALKRYLEELR